MNFLRNLCGRQSFHRVLPVRNLRSFSYPVQDKLNLPKEIDLKNHYTVVAENGVIVCWHPEKPFPYEHTLPISYEAEKIREEESPIDLKLRERFRAKYLEEYRPEFYYKSRTKGPKFVDIHRMFYLNKHALFSHYRDRRIDSTLKPTPPYRKGV